MDSLSLWDQKSKNKAISKKSFTQLAQKEIDKIEKGKGKIKQSYLSLKRP